MNTTTTPPFDCHETQRRASLYLDGRLRAAVRQQVQEHLFGCDDCVLAFQQLRRLSEVAQAMPAPDVGHDLADRVLATVAERRGRVLGRLGHSNSNRIAAAAAVVLFAIATAWGVGFWMGRSVSPETTPPETGSPEFGPPAEVVEVEPAKLRAFERAAQSLVDDIEVIDAVDEDIRRPLVAAQVELFDLDGMADRVLQRSDSSESFRELARFVQEVTARLAADDAATDWSALRHDARTRGLVARPRQPLVVPAAPVDLDRNRLETVVSEFAFDWPEDRRGSFSRLLILKDGFVRGDGDAWSIVESSDVGDVFEAPRNRAEEMMRRMLEAMGR